MSRPRVSRRHHSPPSEVLGPLLRAIIFNIYLRNLSLAMEGNMSSKRMTTERRMPYGPRTLLLRRGGQHHLLQSLSNRSLRLLLKCLS